ncbi:hypothetical protein NCCP691_17480 [Noviherbaspirillum aridicola]|uniref:Uncharacterized protein n=1 Tax=Noviherbaspirillum aridicola TaxID=2849687 RepID=A0ABQ4Q3L3_9BURK|nr:hypothetical protein NCCP691_17480 [Noviherbaspirillum aridicola]
MALHYVRAKQAGFSAELPDRTCSRSHSRWLRIRQLTASLGVIRSKPLELSVEFHTDTAGESLRFPPVGSPKRAHYFSAFELRE